MTSLWVYHDPPGEWALIHDDTAVTAPGGSTTEIQFNDGGLFGGDSGLTWNKADNILNLGIAPPAAGAASVNQSSEGVSASHILWTWGSTFASFLTGVFANGTKASPTLAVANDVALRLRGRWHDGVAYGNTAAEICYVADENHDASGHGARLELWTTPTNSTTLTKVLTVKSDGNVNIESGKEYQVNGVAISSVDYDQLHAEIG